MGGRRKVSLRNDVVRTPPPCTSTGVAARANPGKAAYAIVLARPGLPVIEEADTIGTASNNVAEYTALVEQGWRRWAAEVGVKKLHVYSDSELMVKQMNGEYKVKNEDLRELYEEASRLAGSSSRR